MVSALKAGVSYFALVFAAGFALGVMRVTIMAPRLGETGAIAFELPVMLALSWFVCAWLVRREAVLPTVPARLVMGVAAFTLLMAAEAAVAVFGFGRSLAQHLAGYRHANAQLGLAAQVAFASFPLLRLWLRPRGQA